MPMPLSWTGPITLGCVVILGIFVYPILFARPQAHARNRAIAIVVIVTAVLTVVFFQFARDTQPLLLRGALALFWAIAPLIAASIVRRAERKKG